MAQGKVAHHKELQVWVESMQLAVEVYRATLKMPADERYGLTSQLRRAAAAVPANIAEGAGRGSSADFARFVTIARGSLAELETHLLLCQELELLAACDRLHERITLLRTMLTNLSHALRR
jgi:four helix bundle protein